MRELQAAAQALEEFTAGKALQRTEVSHAAALEEEFFLGLRLVRGVDLRKLSADYGPEALAGYADAIDEMVGAGLLDADEDVVRLTKRGRMLSNLVFERFLSDEAVR